MSPSIGLAYRMTQSDRKNPRTGDSWVAGFAPRARPIAGVLIIAVALSSCSRDGDGSSTSAPVSGPIVATTEPVRVTSAPTVATIDLGTVLPVDSGVDPVASTSPESSVTASTDGPETTAATGTSLPAEDTVVYTIEADDKTLEVQESAEQTVFVVSDAGQNVVYFKNFDNTDPALNELFETPADGGVAKAALVLRDDAGVEVFRVSVADLTAARLAVDQAP